jgi:protein-tyrosine phosphatase
VRPPPAILFVCLGNICRSPLAEAAFRARMAEAGQDWLVDSAGTGGWHAGEAPDPRAQEVALRHGSDIATYQARKLVAADYDRFTHIYALDADNLAAIRRRAQADAGAAIGLLLDAVPGREGRSVADPYFGPDEGFEVTWDEVDAAARALVAQLMPGASG